jgi:hypothetical protein
MAFGGNAGAAGGLLAVVNYVPAPGAIQSAYDANGAMEYQDAQGNLVKPADQTVALVIGGGTLAAYANVTVDGSAADTGILTTAAPAANQHGIPANFGPGRGNWTVQDAQRLLISKLETQIAAPVTGGTVEIIELGFPSGNLTMVFKNLGPNAIDIVGVRLRYDHSMVY